ncbi:Hypothetical Protein FCC1311_118522, partial [Hondaea fermentalgiana]
MAPFKNFEVDMGKGTCTAVQMSGSNFELADASVNDCEGDEDGDDDDKDDEDDQGEGDANIATSEVRSTDALAADGSMFGAVVAKSTPIGALASLRRRRQNHTSAVP